MRLWKAEGEVSNYIVVKGSLSTGFDVWGPFTKQQAIEYYDRYIGSEVLELKIPYDSLITENDVVGDTGQS